MQQPGQGRQRWRLWFAKFDGRQAFATFRNPRFDLLARLKIDDLRLAYCFHVHEDVFRILSFPNPIEEAVALYAIEPFNLYRLILTRRIAQRLAIGALR